MKALSSLLTPLSLFQNTLVAPLQTSACDIDHAPVHFLKEWQILGPFQIGTRGIILQSSESFVLMADTCTEATWGADPLEFYGGFRSLEYDQAAKFPSSLAPDATVSWSMLYAESMTCDKSSAQTGISVSFPHVDLSFMRSIYGWAALQYQAWARGVLVVGGDEPQTIELYTANSLEFYVDGVHHFGGDFYAFRKAPLVLHLEPGNHSIDLRLVRDLRSMGGVGHPTIDVQLEARLSTRRLHLVTDSVVMPDMVNGRPTSNAGSITVRNNDGHDIEISAVSANDSSYFVWLLRPDNFRVAAGQTRPVSFIVSCQEDTCNPYLKLDIEYYQVGRQGSQVSVLHQDHHFVQRKTQEPFKVTSFHEGSVTYAIVRPPPENSSDETESTESLPVMLVLHGAGVDVDSDEMRHIMDPLPNLRAWVIIPTGSTEWSGDDWHTWGFASVESTIWAASGCLDSIRWKGPGMNADRWLVAGHSNGGQGAWYALTHRPDKVFAAALVSGYSSIQNYVPYDLWRPMSPNVRALLDTSLGSYRHELLLENARDIPMMQQHGDIDDNVPVFNSRLMYQLLHQAGVDPSYDELKGKNHWFDGVMTTETLSTFFEQELNGLKRSVHPPKDFALVVANPADTGPKFGVEILHLVRPGQLGKLDVSFSTSSQKCCLRTSNVLALRLPKIYAQTHDIFIDGQAVDMVLDREHNDAWISPDGSWKVFSQDNTPALRKQKQLGGLDAVLRMPGFLQVVSHSRATDAVALQVSRNMYQYFAMDTAILRHGLDVVHLNSNSVRLIVSENPPKGALDNFAIQIDTMEGISIRTGRSRTVKYSHSPSLAAIYLRPTFGDTLELVVWGAEKDGLDIAARLLPMLTGVGQADFVVADKRMLWQGVGGVLAMGFFDHMWNVTENSYLT